MTGELSSWGGIQAEDQAMFPIHWIPAALPKVLEGSGFLPRGMGRSYGDSCLNDSGTLLDTTPLDHFISLDSTTGVLRAEAGVTLDSVLTVIVEKGWFLPVTPGTKFVTLGGAIANDVHGKNHHRAGTFGCHVERFELLRSDGSKTVCSASENTDLFKATIGGLGLTGLITWIEVKLKPISNARIDEQTIPFESVRDFFELSNESDSQFEYTVAWVDSLARGKNLGRGIFFRGNHSEKREKTSEHSKRRTIGVPFHAPSFVLNSMTMRSFNALYYRMHRKVEAKKVHYEPFFYPLDSVRNWNRLYGKRGFFQYQCVVPSDDGVDTINELLERATHANQGSFLSVLKTFGDRQSDGLLSFPRRGMTLALDLPNKGRKTLELMNHLDSVVGQAGGAVYPAKDARMSAESFQRYFPNWRDFAGFVDPKFSSSFWRRVTGEAPA